MVFGALVRAAPSALLMGGLAAVLSEVLAPMLDFIINSKAASKSDLLIQALQSADNNALLVGILGLMLTLIARAVVERRLPG